MIKIALLLTLLALCVCNMCSDNVCRDMIKDNLIVFHQSRHCQRSNKSVIALANFKKVDDCENYARNNNALAYNYAPKIRGVINRFEDLNKTQPQYKRNKHPSGKDIIEQSEEYYNCHILDCPELKNFSSMINDTRFEYYSLYVNPPPPVNATCLPGLGMFIYYDKPENFSRAYNICRDEVKGNLADVLSEIRTNSLSKLIRSKFNSTHREMAFIDLKEKVNNETNTKLTFETSEGFPLECFSYRAWSPGFPRRFKQTGCVTITKDNSWKVIPCSKKQPFICEMFPTDSPKRTIPIRKCSIRKSNNL